MSLVDGYKNFDALLLASGGLDSTTLAYQMHDQGLNVLPLFIDYSQHSAATEEAAARATLPSDIAEKLEVVKLSDVYRGCRSRMIVEADLWRDTVTDDDLAVPYRNLLILTTGAAFAQVRGIGDIYSAFIDSNFAHSVDCTTTFLEQARLMLSTFGGMRLHTPLAGMSKPEVARLGVSLGVPLGETFSCLARSRVPCGACANCIDRRIALQALDIVSIDTGNSGRGE